MSSQSSRARVIAPPVVLAAACVVAGVVADRIRPLPLLPELPILRIGGALLLFACFGLLLLLSLRAFRRHKTTVNPYGTPAALVTSGIFGYSRNPIYVGLLLACLGFAVALNSVWLLLSTFTLFLLLHFGVIKPEERFLNQLFGAPYEAYMKRVRRWL